ncbi:M56 family metallopeptidase [Roseivirga sp. E12]|uniref:M56 family metallopeptidase n=1 Tax=Roseivirga sp. E12 TaxID=2819237 RepID=UPI001ABCFDDF|nr:M56 family metallopeptidase [Roseivirga sp. E12]MBO3700643.1 energy transducer TonB [Roseivirga sp. E12]
MGKHPTIELLEGLNDALIYALESATCLAILYLAYYFLLRREKSFQYNRFYLLAAILFSVTFPLLEIDYNPANTPAVLNSIHQVGNEVGSEPIIEADKAYSYTITAQSERPFLLWWEALLVLYVGGVTIGLAKLLLQIRSFKEIIWFKRHRTRYKVKGDYFLVKTDGSMPTFSFFKYLFWDNTIALTNEEKQQVMDHEMVHIKEKHSYDIMFIELLKVLFWFNPFMYLYKLLLEESHEYLADRKVALQTGKDVYSRLLVKTVFRKMGLEYGSYFGKNQTVKRVQMLAKNKKVNFLRLLIPLPLIALLFFIFSFEAAIPEGLTINGYQIENNTFGASDVVPAPLKGAKDWEEFIEDNITHPGSTVATQHDGEVEVRFTVNRKGLIENLRFTEGLGTDYERQVINALARGGKWSPGIKNGEAQDTDIVLPIQLKRS